MRLLILDLKLLIPRRYPGHEGKNEASKDCSYSLGGHDFSHNGPRRTNRIQMIENLRWAFPDIPFVHR